MKLPVVYDSLNGLFFRINLPMEAPFVVLVGEYNNEATFALKHVGLTIAQSQNELARFPIMVHHHEDENTSFDYRTTRFLHLAAYGLSRLRVNERGSIKEDSSLKNLFKPEEACLFNVFNMELKGLLLNEPELFDEVKQAILKLLPQVTDIVKEDESKAISDFAFVQYGQKVPFKKLSAGPKSLALMFGDMIFRLLAKQPKVKKVADLEGVVIIDELELHLHPKWQQALPYLLHETFPKVQFIVTTNSAVCVASMPENTVFYKVCHDEGKGLEMQEVKLDTQILLPNQILTSELFEVDIFNNKDPRFIDTSNSAEERAKNKAQVEYLKGWFERLEKQGK